MPVRLRISAAARRILRILTENPDGERSLQELAREAGASKTATSHALHELEEASMLAITEEEV